MPVVSSNKIKFTFNFPKCFFLQMTLEEGIQCLNFTLYDRNYSFNEPVRFYKYACKPPVIISDVSTSIKILITSNIANQKLLPTN